MTVITSKTLQINDTYSNLPPINMTTDSGPRTAINICSAPKGVWHAVVIHNSHRTEVKFEGDEALILMSRFVKLIGEWTSED